MRVLWETFSWALPPFLYFTPNPFDDWTAILIGLFDQWFYKRHYFHLPLVLHFNSLSAWEAKSILSLKQFLQMLNSFKTNFGFLWTSLKEVRRSSISLNLCGWRILSKLSCSNHATSKELGSRSVKVFLLMKCVWHVVGLIKGKWFQTLQVVFALITDAKSSLEYSL